MSTKNIMDGAQESEIKQIRLGFPNLQEEKKIDYEGLWLYSQGNLSD